MTHFREGAVAVITGGASGIGAAAAQAFAARGMKLVLFDRDAAGLETVAAATGPDTRVLAGDVSSLADVEALRDLAVDAFGRVDLVMNNAAIGGLPHDSWSGIDAWRRILEVNLFGVINGVHAFAPVLLAQDGSAAIVNTGSKQGITNPPGAPAYAVSKSGVKTLTEQLAYALRQEAGDRVTAHLLVPGWTFTGMTGEAAGGAKPEGAWTSAQVVDRMIAGVGAGDFYILCPDNQVSDAVDKARISWAAGDITENRPALSRWHPDWTDRFDAYVADKTR